MRNFIELDLFPEGVHDFSEFYGVTIIFGQILLQEKEDE